MSTTHFIPQWVILTRREYIKFIILPQLVTKWKLELIYINWS